MKPTHKTPDLRALLREHVPLEPEHELHAQSLALLAEIEAALDEADEKAQEKSVLECYGADKSSDIPTGSNRHD